MNKADKTEELQRLMNERILLLDGAAGTWFQGQDLTEEDYRGERFASHSKDLKGNHEALNLMRPDVVAAQHQAFLEAGSDILETNTFNATSVAQSEYGFENLVHEINCEAAKIARGAITKFYHDHPNQELEKPRFVAGVLGPTGKTLSLSPRVSDPGYRDIRFEQLAQAYLEAAQGLVEGGVDLFLIETAFDGLNAKAAIYALEQLYEQQGRRWPLMISGTITDASGRTLIGQTPEAFWVSVSHAQPLTIGLNCALGAKDLVPHIRSLSQATAGVSVHPNAGLPDEEGQYDDSPELMAQVIGRMADEGLVNIVGGCCGTTPEHIRQIAQRVAPCSPRKIPVHGSHTQLSGLETLVIDDDSLFINVGERTNVSGSRKFARLIREKQYDEAVEIARQQVENGAQIVDVNVDDALLEAPEEMERFLNLLMAEPDVARVPIMIDSSEKTALEAGLRCIGGKGVVNSLSLKEGEQAFLEQAAMVRRYGAAVVVMAFDEKGQADTRERKVEIGRRAVQLLTQEAGFPPQDIILDLNVFAVATGISEHSRYALDFIEAVGILSKELPGVRYSGGISNVSFSFRGNNTVREAMHAVFLYYAIQAGLTMGIVNAGQLAVYDEIDPLLRERVEDVILARKEDADDRLLDVAENFAGRTTAAAEDLQWREQDAAGRLGHALVKGLAGWVEEDALEAYHSLGSALSVIEGPLMAGMDRVGSLFGDGKMFLPQVVKSARVMKKAVGVLQPFLDQAEGQGLGGRIVMATVQGDVHDIGKNIVGVVLQCNGFDVEDLGVMVPPEQILERAETWGADAIGLSGLITPSLEQMGRVATMMEERGWTIPLLIGGATTSAMHTALKLAPLYSGPVVHVKDASLAPQVVTTLLDPERRKTEVQRIRQEQERLREQKNKRVSGREHLQLAQAQEKKWLPEGGWSRQHQLPTPAKTGITVFESIPLEDIIPLIDWRFFLYAWDIDGAYPAVLDHPEKGEAAKRLIADAKAQLERLKAAGIGGAAAVAGIFPAASRGDDILIYTDESRQTVQCVLPQLRQSGRKKDIPYYLSQADWMAPEGSGVQDWLGFAVATGGVGAEEALLERKRVNDDYGALVLQSLFDRIGEAASEWVHREMRTRVWGSSPEENLTPESIIAGNYDGIRPAPGYPPCPDHTVKRDIFALLGVTEAIGVTLTESTMMHPAASVCAYVFCRPGISYFSVGRLTLEQVEDYAQRRGMTRSEAEGWLAQFLSYDASNA